MLVKAESYVQAEAAKILGLNEVSKTAIAGIGQSTTFNQLMGNAAIQKPDGWYLPKNYNQTAMVMETKNYGEDITSQGVVDKLMQYVDIVATKYAHTLGILYNGLDVRIFDDKNERAGKQILKNVQKLINERKTEEMAKLNKEKIYNITKQINDLLHYKFGMNSLSHRMIFTACALVVQIKKKSLDSYKSQDFDAIKAWIINSLTKMLNKNATINLKVQLLIETLNKVTISYKGENPDDISTFVNNIIAIANLLNTDTWNGEDVMAIFFNEFNRYKDKAEGGQVFTPDHVTSFMYRLIDCDKDDRILDATCGSGAFLVKAMCNMINEAAGDEAKIDAIKKKQLYGIELDKDVYALACANMLIHDDGKTNLIQTDAMSTEAADFIKRAKITKVLMNPPYERKYGCLKIVKNVLDNVPKGTKCAFIMPDKKLEKDKGKKLLEKHTLHTIVKMPEELFFGVGITTSIYIFEAGVPQIYKEKDESGEITEIASSLIKAYYLEDDGLQVVKNQGRQDIKNKWAKIEDEWIKAIKLGKHKTMQEFSPLEHLSYQMPEAPLEINVEDFMKTAVDRILFEQKIDIKDLEAKISNVNMYN